MSNSPRRVVRLDASTEPLFWRLHCAERDAGLCFCVAWHVESFEGWAERTVDQNRALRQELFAAGRHDGYLLVDAESGDSAPLAWCQVERRDALPNLRRRHGAQDDASTVTIGCFLVAPDHRRKGLARELLRGVLADLRSRGTRRVEAHPKRGVDDGEDAATEMWTGPEALFLDEGFRVTRDDAKLPILALEL